MKDMIKGRRKACTCFN